MRNLLTILLLLPFALFGQTLNISSGVYIAGHVSEPQRTGISLSLAADSTTTLTDAGTYYKLKARLINGTGVGFVLSGDSAIKFTCIHNCSVLFFGSSNAETNKACRVTYQLFINGIAYTRATTPVDFSASSKAGMFSINRELTLSPNDIIQVKVTSTENSTDLTLLTLYLSFIQIR